jgi:sugar phosphate isomerase/epimerase
MRNIGPLTRRSFIGSAAALSGCAAASTALGANKAEKIPLGLELFSVREELAKDEMGTLERVAGMGYECVEFFAPYYKWTPDHANEIRKKLDAVGLRCFSTHNSQQSFTPDGVDKAIELNKILDAKYIVLASPGHEPKSIDDWKKVADLLNTGNDKMKSSGLHAGYHNHDAEWKPMDGQIPMEIIATETDKSVMLQFDVGTCVAAGADPVAWIDSHPGRIKSLHLKDWSPENKYSVLFGEGAVPWQKVITAAEGKGGVQYYLLEQEGSRFPEMETVERCLVAYRDLRTKKTEARSTASLR